MAKKPKAGARYRFCPLFGSSAPSPIGVGAIVAVVRKAKVPAETEKTGYYLIQAINGEASMLVHGGALLPTT